MKKKNPGGRPPEYSLELAEKICRAIASSKTGLRTICKNNPDFPTPACIRYWLLDYPEFFVMYMQSRKMQAHLLMDETLDVAWHEDGEQDNLIRINRDRLIIDTNKYAAVKLNPETYSDRRADENKEGEKEALNIIKKLADKCLKKPKN